MRSLVVLCVLVAAVVVLGAGNAAAADPAQVSGATLQQMGLAGMELVSDQQGAGIRGRGVTRIYASNYAVVYAVQVAVGAPNVLVINQAIKIGR